MVEQVVGLGDELHVRVLDAVVHHLHVVPGAVGADVGAAGGAVDLGGDAGEHRLDLGVRLGGAAGHDARALERPGLAARHPGADVADPARLDLRRAPPGVGEERVAPVDEDVALVEVGEELGDGGVDRVAALDHEQDRPRTLDRGDQLLRGVRGGDRPLAAVRRDELPGARRGAVEHRHRDVVVGEVASQVLAHHGHPHHPEAAGCGHRHGPLPVECCGRPRSFAQASGAL